MFKKILVPLDGSQVAEGILPYASQLALGLGAPLVLLTVLYPDYVAAPRRRVEPGEGNALLGYTHGYTPAEDTDHLSRVGAGAPAATLTHEAEGPFASQMLEKLEQHALRWLQGVAEGLAQRGVEALRLVSVGKPAQEIVRVAHREACDLIAMSTHGRSPLGRGILGSVTDKVIHSSNLPVLTITPQRAERHRRDGTTLSRIMVALDGSPLAEAALPYVEGLARLLGMKVVLVRVIGAGPVYWAGSGYYPHPFYLDVEREAELEAVQYLQGVAEGLKAQGINVQIRVLKGAPARRITELARQTPQDIIALTTRGRSGLTRWVLGSVAEAVVRASGDPVLVIPPKAALL